MVEPFPYALVLLGTEEARFKNVWNHWFWRFRLLELFVTTELVRRQLEARPSERTVTADHAVPRHVGGQGRTRVRHLGRTRFLTRLFESIIVIILPVLLYTLYDRSREVWSRLEVCQERSMPQIGTK